MSDSLFTPQDENTNPSTGAVPTPLPDSAPASETPTDEVPETELPKAEPTDEPAPEVSEEPEPSPKKQSLPKWAYRVIMGVCLCVFLYSAFQLGSWLLENKQVSDLEADLYNIAGVGEVPDSAPPQNLPNDYWDFINTPFLSVSFDELLQKNSDTVGWLQVGGTTANYPVVQRGDNEYYLTHAFDGSYNSAGWLFADYRCDMENLQYNTIIYGHERKNATMFGSLKNMLNQSWFENKDNHLIRFATPTTSYVYQVFSVYTVEPEGHYLLTEFSGDKDWLAFLQEMQGRSIYDFGVTMNPSDRIITLSTCYGLDMRQVVMARLVKSSPVAPATAE